MLKVFGIIFTKIDLAFLASQYIVSGRQNDIQYQKMIDDINNAERDDLVKKGDPKTICNAIIKQIHCIDLTLEEEFQRNTPPSGLFSCDNVIEIVGTRL